MQRHIFLPFKTPNFVTVLISWLNLDIGFDACFFTESTLQTGFNFSVVYKTLIQLSFPTYVTILVIVVIVASECSSKFAKIIGKGNPVAVLATMIWIFCAKFSHAILSSALCCMNKLNMVHVTMMLQNLEFVLLGKFEGTNAGSKAIVSFLAAAALILCIIFTTLVFSWQWLLRYIKTKPSLSG